MRNNIEVFLSYAREDEKFRKKLEKQLQLLRRQGIITLWHDRNISAGTEWKSQIDIHLNRAQLILLLVSPDFLASDYCYSEEMMQAMERHKNREARVIPIILRPVYWQNAPFGQLQVLPTDGRPVTGSTWRNQDEALFTVAEGIREIIVDSNALQSARREQNSMVVEESSNVKEVLPYILLIDDDGFANGLVKFVLEKEGFEVNIVDHPRAAMNLIVRRRPDLLLLDVTLPYVNGFELAEMLRKEGYQVPIIFLTATDKIEAKIQGFKLGAEDYICKPYNHEELVLRVRAVIRRLGKGQIML